MSFRIEEKDDEVRGYGSIPVGLMVALAEYYSGRGFTVLGAGDGDCAWRFIRDESIAPSDTWRVCLHLDKALELIGQIESLSKDTEPYDAADLIAQAETLMRQWEKKNGI